MVERIRKSPSGKKVTVAALTTDAPITVTKSPNALGASASAARADHKHDLLTAAPIDVGNANAEGIALSAARSDHVHNLPFTAVQLALAAATGNIDVNGQRITDLGAPVDPSDAATKSYVDAVASGLQPKASVRLLSEVPIALTGIVAVDGFNTVTGDRIWPTGQADPIDNGIYIANDGGAWTRATDMAAGSDAAGVYAFVQEGTLHADQGWICTTNNPSDIVGTDPLTFAQFSAFALATTAPVDVTKSAAVIGASGQAARADHKHDVATAAPGTVAVGDVAAEGVAASLARSDHTHAVEAPAAPVDVDKSAASAGAASTVARSDHKHDVSTAAPVAVGTVNSEGVASSLARSDHVHAGLALTVAAPADVTKAAADVGVATTAARADHKHDVSTAAPSTIGIANSEGAATSLARSDHVHNHGAQTVGTLHAVATTLVAGFMSAADKTAVNSGLNVLTPTIHRHPALTGAQNNYDLYSLGNTPNIIIFLLNGNLTFSGFVAPTAVQNSFIWLSSGDTGDTFTLANNSGLSLAGNRTFTPGAANFNVVKQAGTLIYYDFDPAVLAWRVLGGA